MAEVVWAALLVCELVGPCRAQQAARPRGSAARTCRSRAHAKATLFLQGAMGAKQHTTAVERLERRTGAHVDLTVLPVSLWCGRRESPRPGGPGGVHRYPLSEI